MSHAGFLRDHHPGPEEQVITLIRGLADAGEEARRQPLAAGVEHVLQAVDRLVASAPSFADDRAQLGVVVRLTMAPRSMRAAHLDPLRTAGFSDRDIHDLVHVVCCFSYMNRLADGLGVTAQPEPGGWAERLMGVTRTEAHRRWAAGEDA